MIDHPHRSPLMLLLPSTTPGRWAIVLVVTSLAALGVFFLMVGTGQRGGETLFDNWLLTGPSWWSRSRPSRGSSQPLSPLPAGVRAWRRRDVFVLLAVPILWGLVVLTFIRGDAAVGGRWCRRTEGRGRPASPLEIGQFDPRRRRDRALEFARAVGGGRFVPPGADRPRM